ncbi:MAG: rhodanese-like domain-containing protein [Patescibacteria group bacterium]
MKCNQEEVLVEFSKSKLLLVFLAVVILILFVKSQIINNQNMIKSNYEITSVSPAEFKKLIMLSNRFLLDVHIPEQKHILGTNAFIPYNEINQYLSKLPKDKRTPILVYCRSGAMSRQAAEDLIKLGYSEVYDLQGGLNAYNQKFNN